MKVSTILVALNAACLPFGGAAAALQLSLAARATASQVHSALDTSSTTHRTRHLSDADDPASMADVGDFLHHVKLQAPDSTTKVDSDELLEGYSSKYFFVNDGYARLSISGEDNRAELRMYEEWSSDSSTKHSIQGTLRLPMELPSGEDQQYTFMQIHHGESSPLVRISHVGYDNEDKISNHVWAWVLWGDDDIEAIDMGEAPTGDVEFSLSLQDGELSGRVGDSSFSRDLDWSTDGCYFKLGSYVQQSTQSREYYVDFKAISATGF